MRRIVKVVAVAVLVATVLVISSTAAFARPLRGGVPLRNEKVCDLLVENHPLAETDSRFELRPDSTLALCWHISPGLVRASKVVPAT